MYMMYSKDLKKILDEQERFKSARGSLLSVNVSLANQRCWLVPVRFWCNLPFRASSSCFQRGVELQHDCDNLTHPSDDRFQSPVTRIF